MYVAKSQKYKDR